MFCDLNEFSLCVKSVVVLHSSDVMLIIFHAQKIARVLTAPLLKLFIVTRGWRDGDREMNPHHEEHQKWCVFVQTTQISAYHQFRPMKVVQIILTGRESVQCDARSFISWSLMADVVLRSWRLPDYSSSHANSTLPSLLRIKAVLRVQENWLRNLDFNPIKTQSFFFFFFLSY